MNLQHSEGQQAEPIQRSDLAVSILTGLSLIGIFCILIVVKQEEKYKPFALGIMSVVALLGMFYLTTRFLNMYNVLKGELALKFSFALLLFTFSLILAFIGGLDKYMYNSIITTLLGFIGGMGFSKYIFH